MSQPKLENSLYVRLQGAISNALPLEYAIRASESLSPEGMQRLHDTNQQIKEFWLSRGASDEEIHHHELTDAAWDTLQVGFPLARWNGRIFHPDISQLILEGLSDIRRHVTWEDFKRTVPATHYFRVCDLLNGNDIRHRLMASAVRCLQEARKYEKHDQIELEKFLLPVREPVHLHPGVRYLASDDFFDGKNLGILLDLKADFSELGLAQQLQGFLYYYALRREALEPRFGQSSVVTNLIENLLNSELHAEHSSNRVGRMDGYASVLSGLYCWDKRHREKLKLVDAIKVTLKDYPPQLREVSDQAIRKNYRSAAAEIVKFIDKFSAHLPR
jgi:hypothetical protein